MLDESKYTPLELYGEDRPDIFEKRRNRYVFPSYLDSRKYAAIKKISEKCDVRVNERRELIVPSLRRKVLEDALMASGITVGALDIILGMIKVVYSKIGTKELGSMRAICLSKTWSSAKWEYFDEGSRRWGRLFTAWDKDHGIMINMREGNVMRKQGDDGEWKYFIIMGQGLVNIAERAATTLAFRTFQGSRKLSYANTGNFFAVRKDEIGWLPPDLYDLVFRFSTFDNQRIFTFQNEDKEAVSQLFALARIQLLGDRQFRLAPRQRYAKKGGFTLSADERAFLNSSRGSTRPSWVRQE